MAAIKGVVTPADYAFNAAAKTVTFSATYTGLALSDIMYITNVKSGVNTVIYDPFDATKTGSLTGLVLTLVYDTTAMSNGDSLQIIVSSQQKNGLTDTELRATPVPISGTVLANTGLSQPLTDTQLRVTPVPVSGTVTVDTSLLAKESKQDTQITAEQGIQTAVQIMDDWDESDRAKVNPIVGQAGVDGGSGAASAKTQRVILATDQAAVPVTFSGLATDNTSLYSNNLAATGAIAGIDTTGYSSISFQLTGVWDGELRVEGSNDNSEWSSLLISNVGEISIQDKLTVNGIYQINTGSKYIRLNVVQYSSGTITVLIFGRVGSEINMGDRLSLAMDKQAGLPVYVSEVDSKKDVLNALIPSDAPRPIYGFGQATNAIIFQVDTTGYQSIAVQAITVGSAITVQTSNDGVTWVALPGVGAAVSQTITIAGMFFFPVIGRFVRGLMGGASFTNVVVYLRQQPFIPITTGGQVVNLQTIGGTSVVAAGQNGVLSVGGPSTVGIAPGAANPVLIGGIDTSGLTRRVLTDLAGRLLTALVDQTGTTRPVGGLSPGAGGQGIASQAVQDISSIDGQSQMDLLSQILLELRISNYYMFSLPEVLQRLLNDTSKSMIGFGNEPGEFRNEQSIFNN